MCVYRCLSIIHKSDTDFIVCLLLLMLTLFGWAVSSANEKYSHVFGTFMSVTLLPGIFNSCEIQIINKKIATNDVTQQSYNTSIRILGQQAGNLH